MTVESECLKSSHILPSEIVSCTGQPLGWQSHNSQESFPANAHPFNVPLNLMTVLWSGGIIRAVGWPDWRKQSVTEMGCKFDNSNQLGNDWGFEYGCSWFFTFSIAKKLRFFFLLALLERPQHWVLGNLTHRPEKLDCSKSHPEC